MTSRVCRKKQETEATANVGIDGGFCYGQHATSYFIPN